MDATKLKVAELRSELSKRGASSEGLKADLVKRLADLLGEEATSSAAAAAAAVEAEEVDEPAE